LHDASRGWGLFLFSIVPSLRVIQRIERCGTNVTPFLESDRFDVIRTLVLVGDSEYVQRHKVIASEAHGCDNEVYPVGSSFLATGKSMTFVSRVFAAGRVCVNIPYDGRTAVCSAESTTETKIHYTVDQPQTYADCITNGRNRLLVSFNFQNQEGPIGTKSNNCLGIDTSTLSR